MSTAQAFFRDDAAKARYTAAYDAVLRGWPVPHENLDIPTRLGATHVVTSGRQDAPPLILLHAALATATVWRPNVEALSRRFRVCAVDVIGQSGRSVANRRIKTRRDFADWLCDLLDGLGVEKASIVGSSYGGFLALSQASLTPERVDRVVLISPGGTFASFVPVVRRMAHGMLAGAVLRFFGVKRPKPDLAVIFGAKSGFRPEDQDWLALGRMLMDGSVRMNAIMPTVLPDKELKVIAAPTLLLIAEHETLYDPHATLQSALARMPGLKGEIVRDAHHLAAMAQPEWVNRRILAFLEPSQP